MDQAEKLRNMIHHTGTNQMVQPMMPTLIEPVEEEKHGPLVKKARILTITSGKGGVGKTNVAVNLALSLMEEGLRVVILDADFGLANIEVVIGSSPQYNLLNVVKKEKNLIEVITKGPNNLRFISGGAGIQELAKISVEEVAEFSKSIHLLDSFFDVILVDTGAGVSSNVLHFVLAAEEVILVTTPEPTSLTDGYALLKMISGSRMDKQVQVIMNRTSNEEEGLLVFQKLKDVTDKYLKIDMGYLGSLSKDVAVEKAVRSQKPFLIEYPRSLVAKQMRQIGRKILQVQKDAKTGTVQDGAKGFIDKLIRMMRK
jgi:flagellar biosynthesis protein FlhG